MVARAGGGDAGRTESARAPFRALRNLGAVRPSRPRSPYWLPSVMPRLFSALFVLAAAATASPSAGAQDASDIGALVGAYHEAGRFDGAVLVSDGGEVVYRGAVGLADATWGVPNAPDTRFRVGSVTKQFTAALVLQLVEEGLVDLDAPVTTYVPDYPAESGDRVTVHHLLTHTSGIPSYTSLPDFGDVVRDPFAPDSFLAVFQDLPLEFEPGAEWRYNNSGYFLLGVIVEKVTGQPYAEALRERILAPLGMGRSAYGGYAEVVPQEATGYVRAADGRRHAAYLDPSVPYAAGMLVSTVDDLKTWSDALWAGRVFRSPETLALMNAPHEAVPGTDGHYGYGVFSGTAEVGGREVPFVEHGGAIDGFVTSFWRLTDRDAVIVAVSNASDPSSALVRGIVQVLHGETPPMPKPPAVASLREALAAGGVAAVEAAFRAARAGDVYDVTEGDLNTLGYEALAADDVETALAVFRLNVEAFPDAWNVYDSLGEALRAAGDAEGAVASYQRAIELNPAAASARRALDELGAPADAVTVPVETLERYVGRYELQPGFVLDVTRDGGTLFIQATGQPRFETVPLSMSEFAPKAFEARVAFEAGSPAPALTLFQGGAELRAPRVEE